MKLEDYIAAHPELGEAWTSIITRGTGKTRTREVGYPEEILTEYWSPLTNNYEVYRTLDVPLPINPPTPVPGGPTGRVVSAIDVSSHQSLDAMTQAIDTFDPEHVVVKLYQDFESPPESVSHDQLELAHFLERTTTGYGWLYAASHHISMGYQIGQLKLYHDRYNFKIVWLDIERYPPDGSIPSADDLELALDEADRIGLPVGIYTSPGEFALVDKTGRFSDRPLWEAYWYNDRRPDLEGVPLVEGWGRDKLWGHQWTSTPLDRSVFLDYAV